MIKFIFLVIVLLTVEDQSFLIIRRWKTMKHGNGACTNVSIEKIHLEDPFALIVTQVFNEIFE